MLFSQPEARAVVLDLRAGDELSEHSVRETAIVQVVAGSVSFRGDGKSTTCESGTLLTFSPGERHAVQALADSRLLLLLAPWPAEGHYSDDESPNPDRIPSAIEEKAISES